MTLHAGTDAGSVAVFDPAALPEDYDSVIKSNTVAIIERLHKDGKLFWFDTHGDGSYRLGVFESPGLPERLTQYVASKEELPSFHIPSGTLCFTGIEYIARDNFAPLLKHPHMGENIRVTSGTRAATIYTLEYPDTFEDSLLTQSLSPKQLAARNRTNVAVPTGCLTLVCLVLAFFLLPRAVWAEFVLPPCAAVIGIIIWLMKSRMAKSTDAAAKKVTDEYPDFALVMHP